jgi:hypothetical protein
MIDPANFACCEDFRWNLFFRGKSYLNSIVVNGQNNKRRSNFSSWLKPNPSSVSRWLTEEKFELVQGTQTLDQDLEHTRILFSVRNDYWLVLDYFEPPNYNQTPNLYTQHWYLTPGAIGIDQNGCIRLERNNQKFSLTYQAWSGIAEIPINAKIGRGTGELSKIDSQNLSIASTVMQTYHESGNVLSLGLLRMETAESSNLLNISRLPAQTEAFVICLQFEGYTDYLYFNFNPLDKSKVKFGDYSFSGDFCHVRLNKTGKATEVRVVERTKPFNELFSQPNTVLNLNDSLYLGAF